MPQSIPSDPARVRLLTGGVGGDRDLGGHVEPQPARVKAQRDRPDLPGRVGQVAVQPHHERRAALGDRIRSSRPCRENVPSYQRTGTMPRRRRGNRAADIPALTARAVANHASQ